MRKNIRYTVRNYYGRRGESHHVKLSRAIRACEGREGVGWLIYDRDGRRVDY